MVEIFELSTFWYLFCKRVLVIFPDKAFLQLVYFINCLRFGVHYRKLDFNNPVRFNEKLNFLKFNERNQFAPIVADKVKVREFVKSKIGSKYLIPLIGIYNTVDEIPFDDLPNQFALKTNHGSGWNLICKDKFSLNWDEEKSRFNRWLNMNAFYLSREWQYKHIVPKMICEQLLEYEISDYKIFCSNGEPKLIQVDTDRFSFHQRSFFDTEWNELNLRLVYPNIESAISKPKTLQEMLSVSSMLSKHFLFSRIDLYEMNDNVYFGEITMYPEGGVGPIPSLEEDFLLGKLIDLSKLGSSLY